MASTADRSVVRIRLGTQGTSEVLAYTATVPIIVCSTDDPLRGVSGAMSQRTDMLDPLHEAIIADARKLWGWPAFPGLGYRVMVHVGQDAHDPRFVTMIENVPRASLSQDAALAYDVELEVVPRDDGVTPQAKKLQVCTTKVGNKGDFQAPQSGSTEHGDHVVVETTEPRAWQTICPQGNWWAPDQVLKICVRPTLSAKVGTEEFPTAADLAAGRDVFSLQFQEAFPAAHQRAVARGGGGAVEFFGIDPRWVSTGPQMSISRYGRRSGLNRQRSETASGFLTRHGHAQRYVDVVELYGNHEGGWYAIQTYDGPKLSFGWAQLTFGPNPSAATRITEGYGKNFMSFLATNHEDCFHRLFGVYGHRITFADEDERSAWTTATSMARRYSASTYAKTFFWRVPCCWSWKDAASLPTSTIYEPPTPLKITRVQTASVGFAGLLVQAFTDAAFERAMAQWIVGMIDLAAAAAGNNPTKGAVTRRLYQAIRGTTVEAELGHGGYAEAVQRQLATPLAAQPF